MQVSPFLDKDSSRGELLHPDGTARDREIRRLKVLFLACYFPPAQGSACVRTWNLAKHLARLDWDVTVVTPDPLIWRNIDDPGKLGEALPNEGIRRILTDHRWRNLAPHSMKCWNAGIGWAIGGACRKIARHFAIDSAVGWVGEAESACRSLTRSDADVILATGPPFSAFVLAKRLSQRLKLPYVLDYRDPWVAHPDARRSAVLAKREREQQLIGGASAVTVVSKSLLNGKVEGPGGNCRGQAV
jgi:hypothetical protein